VRIVSRQEKWRAVSDQTGSHFDRRDASKRINCLVWRLEQLGMNVVLAPAT